MTTCTAHALRELQELTASIVCPELPLTDEINDGTPLTIEHIYALSRIAGRDVRTDIQIALEYARDIYRAAPGDTNNS